MGMGTGMDMGTRIGTGWQRCSAPASHLGAGGFAGPSPERSSCTCTPWGCFPFPQPTEVTRLYENQSVVCTFREAKRTNPVSHPPPPPSIGRTRQCSSHQLLQLHPRSPGAERWPQWLLLVPAELDPTPRLCEAPAAREAARSHWSPVVPSARLTLCLALVSAGCWESCCPQTPPAPPSYLPECVYNYPGSRARRPQPAESAAGQRGAGGQHAVYFNFSESFLGAFPPPLLNSDEPLGR